MESPRFDNHAFRRESTNGTVSFDQADWCGNPRCKEDACDDCCRRYLQRTRESREFSGNRLIDELIWRSEDLHPGYRVHWIPHEHLQDMKHIADGGFSSVYYAICNASRIKWNDRDQIVFDRIHTRKQPVAIKYLNNSTNISKEFMHELQQTLQCWSYSPNKEGINFIQLLGVTINPETQNYGMVMQYLEHGNLRSYLTSKDVIGLNSYDKINCISILTEGLTQIHRENILHYDLHSGNTLVGKANGGYTSILISDLGLSGSANRSIDDGKIYGVLPYIAPEVIRGNPYTDKADIYSLGMLTWEILTGKQPFSQSSHDRHLAQRICNGDRPSFPIEIPYFFQEFICNCWNPDPSQRPSAKELELAMDELRGINGKLAQLSNVPDSKIEIIPKSQSIEPNEPHPEAVYTSRCFTTEELRDMMTQDIYF